MDRQSRCWFVACVLVAWSIHAVNAQPCTNTLRLDCPSGELLDTVSVAIYVTDCDRQIDAFGLDVAYTPAHLQFVAIDIRGTLIENWTAVVAGAVPGSSDRVRVGGFDVTGFGPGPEGLLVTLRFVVVTPLPFDSPIAFVGGSLTDDIAGFEPADCAVAIRGVLIFQCPPDQEFPPFATVPTVTLSGFQITNPSPADELSFDYYVTAEGPATLTDNGDPRSISGTTPALAPGGTYSPPEALLVVPEIRYPAEQLVIYHVRLSGMPALLDSCVTTIHFDFQTPVLISSFEVSALEVGVALKWLLRADEGIRGFNIYRRAPGGEWGLVNAERLLDPSATRYSDLSAAPGQDYAYALAVVLSDGSEVRSQAVRVTTRRYPLALHPNRPNPFNPSTTISFTLPERMSVNLSVYNIEGRWVKTLLDQTLSGGYKETTWDGKDERGTPVSSGVYFYRLRADKKVLTSRMVILK